MRRAVLFLILLGTGSITFAQSGIRIKKTDEKIILDGEMTENAWKESDVASNFTQYFPTDSALAEAGTEVRVTYDDQNIYIFAKMDEAREGKFVTTSLRRDYRGGASDGITLVFDTFHDKTNAFIFGVNPYNVQREALVSNGGDNHNDFDLSWDNKWRAKTKISKGFWTAEIAIPFKTLRFKNGVDTWNMNFYRIDTRYNERSSWTPIPRNFQMFSLAYSQELKWDEPLKKTGPNISLIPYVTGGLSKDQENAGDLIKKGDIGLDAKIGITPGLNLDLTVNPDFSQVEVDEQVTNLSRFEIFFPEKRQFFLENQDLFSNFGFGRIRPFFSRRIGIVADTANNQNIQNRIIYGARLSGKITRNLRMGILNMQAAKDTDIGLPSINYSVAVLQQKVFKRSSISAFFVNKQNFASNTETDSLAYNRAFGLEYNLASNDSKWTGKAFYHRSFNPFHQDDNFAHGLSLNYNKRSYSLEWMHEWVGENYDAQVGFVPRHGYFRINPQVTFRFYPSSSLINNHGPRFEASYFWSKTDGELDHELKFDYDLSFTSGARLSFNITQNFTYLTDSFDPTNTDGAKLPAATDYTYYDYRLSFNSNERRAFFFRINHFGGQYFNGERYGISGTMTYRAQPYALISLNYNYNKILLPDPYSDADLILLGPKLDITFSRSLFLTTFFQFNNQSENVNINARLQWRFKPVSDIFLVYTDNYASTNWAVKNRAIVFKVTYWLNL